MHCSPAPLQLSDTGVDLDSCFMFDPRQSAKAVRQLMAGTRRVLLPEHRKVAQYLMVNGRFVGGTRGLRVVWVRDDGRWRSTSWWRVGGGGRGARLAWASVWVVG